MTAWRMIALAPWLAAAAPAPEPVMPDGRPADFYSCRITQALEGGRVTVTARLELDGRRKDFLVNWSASDEARGFGQSMSWWGGDWQALTDATPRLYLSFSLPQALRARLEVRRTVNGRPAGRALFVSRLRLSRT